MILDAAALCWRCWRCKADAARHCLIPDAAASVFIYISFLIEDDGDREEIVANGLHGQRYPMPLS